MWTRSEKWCTFSSGLILDSFVFFLPVLSRLFYRLFPFFCFLISRPLSRNCFEYLVSLAWSRFDQFRMFYAFLNSPVFRGCRIFGSSKTPRHRNAWFDSGYSGLVVVGCLGRGTTTLHCTHHARSHMLKSEHLCLPPSLGL